MFCVSLAAHPFNTCPPPSIERAPLWVGWRSLSRLSRSRHPNNLMLDGASRILSDGPCLGCARLCCRVALGRSLLESHFSITMMGLHSLRWATEVPSYHLMCGMCIQSSRLVTWTNEQNRADLLTGSRLFEDKSERYWFFGSDWLWHWPTISLAAKPRSEASKQTHMALKQQSTGYVLGWSRTPLEVTWLCLHKGTFDGYYSCNRIQKPLD